MVMVYTLFTIAWLFVWQWTARRIIGLRFWEVIKDVMPTLCIALLVMATTYFVTLPLHHLLLLLICRILIATLLYATIMKVLHVEMMDELLLFIKKR